MSEPEIETIHTLTVDAFGVSNRIDFQLVHTPDGIVVRQTVTAIYETVPLETETAAEMVQVKYGLLLASALEEMAKLLRAAGD